MSESPSFVESWNFIAFGVVMIILLFNVFYMQIFSPQIRNAWDNRKSMARNLQDMGLAFDPNRSLPLKKTRVNNIKIFSGIFDNSSLLVLDLFNVTDRNFH